MDAFDLIIIGTGSGNSILTPDFDDWNVAVVERDVFGGTCLNRGCIPSKMFVYASDMAEAARNSGHLGVDSQVNAIRWDDIRQRVFGLIDPIAAGGEDYRRGLDNITVFSADARFLGPKELEVGPTTITADTIVLAAGARPFVPDLPGLAEVGYDTSASIMRIAELPPRMTVLGGGPRRRRHDHQSQRQAVAGRGRVGERGLYRHLCRALRCPARQRPGRGVPSGRWHDHGRARKR